MTYLQQQRQKTNPLSPRIIASLFLFGSVLAFPWWLTLLGATLFSLVLPHYWEVIVFGLFFDLLFAFPGTLTFIGTLTGIILYILSRIIRNSIRT